MERTFVAAMLAVALAGLGSGCFGMNSGPAPDASTSPGGASDADTDLGNATGEMAVRFAAGAFDNVTLWHNGTVKRQDLCGGPACPEQRVDVAASVPEGVAVRVEMALAYPPSEDSLYLDIEADDADFYGLLEDGGAGFNTVDATLVRRGGSVEAVVGQDLPVASTTTVTEIPFSLTVQITVYDETFPSRVPFAVDAAGNLTVVGAGLDGELRIWAPDDAYVGAFPLAGSETRIALPNGSAEGEWVVVAVGLSAPATLVVPRLDGEAADPPVGRPLGLEDRVYPPSVVPNQGPLTLTGEFERLPLRLGFYYGRETCCYAMAQVTVTLASPTATLLTINGDCVCQGFEAFFAPWQAEGFVPGAYTATFEHSGSQDVSFGFFALEYVR